MAGRKPGLMHAFLRLQAHVTCKHACEVHPFWWLCHQFATITGPVGLSLCCWHPHQLLTILCRNQLLAACHVKHGDNGGGVIHYWPWEWAAAYVPALPLSLSLSDSLSLAYWLSCLLFLSPTHHGSHSCHYCLLLWFSLSFVVCLWFSFQSPWPLPCVNTLYLCT